MRTATFTNFGIDVTGKRTIDEVLETAGLDYTVKTEPIYFPTTLGGDALTQVPGKLLTLKEDTREPIAVVSDKYKVCQNRDAFEFIDSIHDDIEFISAGETKSNLIYIIARMQNVKVLGDEITPFLIFQNSHDGLGAVKATISPLRIVCQNQFNISFRQSPNTVRIVHSSGMDNKLVAAREMLSDVAAYMDRFAVEAETLAQVKLSDDKLIKAFNEVFKYDREKMSERQIVTFSENLEEFLRAYRADDNQNFKGTVWGGINGAADYLTHHASKRPSSQETRFVNVTLLSTLLNQFYTQLTH